MSETMRAIEYDAYGPPKVLQLRAVPKPAPGAGEVLVRVMATSVNPVDAVIRAGKLSFRTGKTFPKRTGIDLAGEVAALGAGAAGFKVGDRVWGVMALEGESGQGQGAAADFVTLPADRLAPSPKGMGAVEAAGLSSVGAVAILALVERGRLKQGERLLVRGAAGGVGCMAVQLGRHLGAHVTAIASEKDLAFVKELGADVALDRRKTSYASLARFDVILDLVGTDLGKVRARLGKGGRMYGLGVAGLGTFVSIFLSKIHGSRQIVFFSAAPNGATMAELTRLVAAGALKPVVSGVYPLAKIDEAQASVEAGGGRGKRVVDLLADAA